MQISTQIFPEKEKLESFCNDAWGNLKKTIVHVEYPDSVTAEAQLTWDEWLDSANEMLLLNEKILSNVHGKIGVYGIFIRNDSSSDWIIKYIGHTTFAKTRLKNHLFTKHEKTGAKLSEVKSAIGRGKELGVSFVAIEPTELRRYVEMMLIDHLQPDWCRHGRSIVKAPIDYPVKKKIVLIACVRSQLPSRASARELFISPLFRYSLKYAETQNSDHIFILSAEYGLLELDDVIDPYDVAMLKMAKEDKLEWSTSVINQLKEHCDLEKDEFTLLAGRNYRDHIISHLRNHSIPMKNLPIGKMLNFLKSELSSH